MAEVVTVGVVGSMDDRMHDLHNQSHQVAVTQSTRDFIPGHRSLLLVVVVAKPLIFTIHLIGDVDERNFIHQIKQHSVITTMIK